MFVHRRVKRQQLLACVSCAVCFFVKNIASGKMPICGKRGILNHVRRQKNFREFCARNVMMHWPEQETPNGCAEVDQLNRPRLSFLNYPIQPKYLEIAN